MWIALTSIMVDDQDKAEKFYVDVLGFQKNKDFPAGGARWLTVTSPEGHPDVELVLEPTGLESARTFQKALYASGIPLTALGSVDLDAEYERLVARGVKFRGPPSSGGEGVPKIATFDDTCGNYIMLFEVKPQPR